MRQGAHMVEKRSASWLSVIVAMCCLLAVTVLGLAAALCVPDAAARMKCSHAGSRFSCKVSELALYSTLVLATVSHDATQYRGVLNYTHSGHL